ncbi:MAG: pentapeptide repeat-containing protein [Trebonia sp.]
MDTDPPSPAEKRPEEAPQTSGAVPGTAAPDAPQVPHDTVDPAQGKQKKPSKRDWLQVIQGFTAIVALAFAGATLAYTGIGFRDSHQQLQLNEQGQTTDWYSAAITDLGSSSADARVGGIYLLQQVLRDAPAEQPVVIEILTAFIRDRVPIPPTPVQQQASLRGLPSVQPTADVQAALTVLANRNPGHDGGAAIDLNLTDLAGANLPGAHFSGACLVGASLSGANLQSADLQGTDLFKANAYGTNFLGADLQGADLNYAQLISANTFDDASNPRKTATDLKDAELYGANLTSADFGTANFDAANMVKSIMRNTYLKGADFILAHTRQAYFVGAVGENLDLTDSIHNDPPASPRPCGIG